MRMWASFCGSEGGPKIHESPLSRSTTGRRCFTRSISGRKSSQVDATILAPGNARWKKAKFSSTTDALGGGPSLSPSQLYASTCVEFGSGT